MIRKTGKTLRSINKKASIDPNQYLQPSDPESDRHQITDSEIITTPLLLSDDEHFQTFKTIITNEKIVFSSWFIASHFDMTMLKNYCNNFELKIHLTLSEDPDVRLPEEIVRLIGKYSSTQLALNRFFGFEENIKILKELYEIIITDSEETGFGYFKFEDQSKNLLGGGALVLVEDEESLNHKIDLALHILNQNHGIGSICLEKLFKKAFEECDVDEIWSRSAKKDLEITNFMCKHGMIIKDDEKSGEQFYFMDKKMYEALDK